MLVNEFSWSHSRDRLFSECQLKYYYHYYGSWGGWEKNASERIRKLYVLKNLTNRKMWVGTVVHKTIESLLSKIKNGEILDTFENINSEMIESMRKDYKNSVDGKYNNNPKQYCGFTEHVYFEPVSRSEWKEISEQAEHCLRVFWNSDLFEKFKSTDAQYILEIEKLSYFMLDGIKVYVSPDYCVIEDGLVNVYDWKAGKTLSDATDAQLACYALYASQTWGVEAELLRLVEYNLYHDVIKEHHCDGVDFKGIKEQIFESVVKMKSLLMDAEGNMALEESFKPAEDKRVCTRCKFRGACNSYEMETAEAAA
ncbi:MAG TPA: hypothetical protein DIT94_01850 [Deltaproteobacteria bacterium]|nr:hypothetical protein [Deltaproteobacteria bacterium]